jgi:hypothetical protein
LEKEPQLTAADVGLGGSNSQLNTGEKIIFFITQQEVFCKLP